MKKIEVSVPFFDKKEKALLIKCLESGYISSVGNYVEKFQNKIKNYVKSNYCLACINGTSALHIALKLIGIKKDDEVIVPSMTFVATVNAVIYLNASPIFMDCNRFLNLDEDKTIEFLKTQTIYRNKISYNKKSKKPIKAIIIAHMYGKISALNKLIRLCKKKNIKIIEDAAESLGSFYNNSLHTGLLGDIGCLSFNGNKIITTGGGGAIITNKKKYFLKAKNLINQSRVNSIDYIHNDVGYNYRISNLHSAIGLAQFTKLKKILKKKEKIYNFYIKKFKNFKKFTILRNPTGHKSNNWINILNILDPKINYKKLIQNLSLEGIQCRPIWYPLTAQKHLKKFQKYKIENTIKLHKKYICLPSSSGLTSEELNKIINCFKKYD